MKEWTKTHLWIKSLHVIGLALKQNLWLNVFIYFLVHHSSPHVYLFSLKSRNTAIHTSDREFVFSVALLHVLL